MTNWVRGKRYSNPESCGMFGEGFLLWLLESKTCYAEVGRERYDVAHAFLGIIEYFL